MNIDQEDLETFLIETELISQKVKALAENRITPEEIDRLEAVRGEDRRRREEAKQRKERQAYERMVRGRDGKGITKDFKHFCRFCHKEYQLDTPTCLKCNRKTMTLEQRQTQLHGMVEDYKYNKKSREEKRQKWEMFQKTQAAFWKKSSNNYNQKWEYFVEESDEEPDKDPILPTNDPNFKALEMDIEERKARRAKDTEKAKNLKDKGNAAMKEGDYQKAMEFYTLALEHIKDIKSIYTNRALAFIKLKKYKKAIKDCTNVIEFMEVFEKIGDNKDLAFKAFSRRALAKKELKEYKQALEDINEALKLIPNDKNAMMTKKEIEGFIQHTETVSKLIKESNEKKQQEDGENDGNDKGNVEEEEESDGEKENESKNLEKEIVRQLAEEQLQEEEKAAEKKKEKEPKKVQDKEEDPIKEIPKRLESLTEENVEYLLNLILRKPELKSIFISAKGIQKTLDHIIKQESTRKEILLICICLTQDGVGEKRVWEWGFFKLIDTILAKFQDETKLNQSLYDFIDNLFEILIPITLYEPYRLQLSSSTRIYDFIDTLFPKLITKYKKQTTILDHFCTFFSNLASGDSALKTTMLKKEKFVVILESLYLMVFDYKSKNRKILELKQTLYSLIANLITHPDLRKAFVEFAKNNNRFQDLKDDLELFPRQSHNFNEYIENLLSVLANASLETQIEANEIAEVIMSRFISDWEHNTDTIVYRGLLAVSRFKYTSNLNLTKWLKTFDKLAAKLDPLGNLAEKNMQQVVKLLNIMLSFTTPETISALPPSLFASLVKFVGENSVQQNLFCNTCNLFGILIAQKGPLQQQILKNLKLLVGKLVEIAKERTGNWRKSAAILLGKCSVDPACRAELDRHHGMDVLKSIASFVIDKK